MNSAIYEPPKFFTRLLNWSLPDDLKEPLIGDLWEDYASHFQSQGAIKAGIWYRRQALKTSLQYMLKTKRGFLMLVLSLIAFFGIMIMAMVFGGDIFMFSNVPSLLIVFPALLFAIAASSGRHAKLAFRYFLDLPQDSETKDIQIVTQFYIVFGNSAMWLGVLGTIIGWIAMGSNMDDISKLGPAFAVSILTVFYALIIKVICYVAEQRIKTQQLLHSK